MFWPSALFSVFSGLVIITAAEENCTLPQHPKNGHWVLLGAKQTEFQPGMIVETQSIIQIYCERDYKLTTNEAFIYCDNGKWSSSIDDESCKPICPAIRGGKHVNVICSSNGGSKVTDCVDPSSGTTAKIECDYFYEISSTQRNDVLRCYDGNWDKPEPHCKPVCGKIFPKAEPLIGSVVENSKTPWKAAIFSRKNDQLLCGGTLINERLILTAAHCVTYNDEDLQIRAVSNESLVVAVGNYGKTFVNQSDLFLQVSKVKEIIFPQRYKGVVQNFYSDIALIVSEIPFGFSKNILPVCLDQGNLYQSVLKDPSNTAIVLGWGLGSKNQALDSPKEISVRLLDFAKCYKQVPPSFQQFLTQDKFCTTSLGNGTALCKGDSGGGVVIMHNNETRSYVVGVVSIGPQFGTGTCDSQEYVTVTNVSEYLEDFILPAMHKYSNQ